MRRSCWYDWRLELGVLLTLLVWGSAVPPIRAGCGAPTMVVWSSVGTPHTVESAGESKVMPNSLLHHSVPGRQPCSGPHCSHVPLVPPAPPATSPAPIQEWACLAALSSGADLRGSAHPLEEDLQTPIFRTFRIYHPPR